MTPEAMLDGKVTLWPGDCREALRHLPDASIDSVVTDPPYALVSIIKRFGKPGAAPAKGDVYARAAAGFMGQQWDTGETAFAVDFWREVFRVLKPGGHVAAFAGTRTYHRLACAIEDAGFEIRDQLAWVYGSGFPKSHDVSKAIDKHLGAARPVVGREKLSNDIRGGALLDAAHGTVRPALERDVTTAATDEARTWEGWGTALKPAWEPIVLARKPLPGTVAENVLVHGTGALNIDECRIGDAIVGWGGASGGSDNPTQSQGRNYRMGAGEARPVQGRWPANIVHDGSDEVMAAFPDTKSGELLPHHRKSGAGLSGTSTFAIRDRTGEPAAIYGDAGSAARFFYSAKADADDRVGSKHPTVKPVDLMQWLVRLITPPGGLVLDPFSGTGTTGEAAWRERMRAMLVEREPAYQADIRRRMELALAGPATRRRAAACATAAAEPSDGLGIFGAIGASEKEDV